MKRYMNWAIFYAVIAMVGGVFYREFTKMFAFSGQTALAFVHPHYFMLGTLFFLLLAVMEHCFKFTDKKTNKIMIFYHIGLNLTCVMLVVRGIIQVLNVHLTFAMNASIAGVAGIGHILLGVSIILLLLNLKARIANQ